MSITGQEKSVAEKRQRHFDSLYARHEANRPREFAGRGSFVIEHRTFNDYCREMDEWTAEYNRLLKADGDDAMTNWRDQVHALSPTMLTAWDEEILLRLYGRRAETVYARIVGETDRDFRLMRHMMLGRPKRYSITDRFVGAWHWLQRS